MSVELGNYTLTYKETSSGWPSFYSYEPEFIKGMNQYLYTFKNGNMYRHNVNETRNEFYGIDPTDPSDPKPTTITTVVNTDALTTKVFKALDLESTDPWEVSLFSDLQSARTIQSTWFEKKEGDYFAHIRGLTDGTNNFSLRSANGLGEAVVDASDPADTTLTFPVGTQIGSIISTLDLVYATATSTPPAVSPAPTLAGQVITPLVSSSNVLHINTTISGATAPTTGDLILYIKNQVAESHGMLGHYAVMTLSNNLTTATEMIAVKVDIMKSYP